MDKLCLRCNAPIIGRTSKAKYCSAKCSKLYLKSEYRKRNKEKLYAYRNKWRSAKNGGNRPITYPAKYRELECLNCGDTRDLQVAHVKPLDVGGTHQYVITLCRRHHHKFDVLLRDFWNQGFDERSLNQ